MPDNVPLQWRDSDAKFQAFGNLDDGHSILDGIIAVFSTKELP
jgi:hypothetical protein